MGDIYVMGQKVGLHSSSGVQNTKKQVKCFYCLRCLEILMKLAPQADIPWLITSCLMGRIVWHVEPKNICMGSYDEA